MVGLVEGFMYTKWEVNSKNGTENSLFSLETLSIFRIFISFSRREERERGRGRVLRLASVQYTHTRTPYALLFILNIFVVMFRVFSFCFFSAVWYTIFYDQYFAHWVWKYVQRLSIHFVVVVLPAPIKNEISKLYVDSRWFDSPTTRTTNKKTRIISMENCR